MPFQVSRMQITYLYLHRTGISELLWSLQFVLGIWVILSSKFLNISWFLTPFEGHFQLCAYFYLSILCAKVLLWQKIKVLTCTHHFITSAIAKSKISHSFINSTCWELNTFLSFVNCIFVYTRVLFLYTRIIIVIHHRFHHNRFLARKSNFTIIRWKIRTDL